ncbi:MAG: cupin domain-containing protein [Haloarculaceae archaeon]
MTADSVERTTLDALDSTPHAAVFESAAPRTVRLQLTAGERMPRHRHPESNVVLYLVDGVLDLTLGEEVYRLEGGDVVRFDGDCDISPHAVEESTALVVFAPRE